MKYVYKKKKLEKKTSKQRYFLVNAHSSLAAAEAHNEAPLSFDFAELHMQIKYGNNYPQP